MTPEQRSHFCRILKHANKNHISITVDDISDILGISKKEASKSWSTEYTGMAYSYNTHDWVLYISELKSERHIDKRAE